MTIRKRRSILGACVAFVLAGSAIGVTSLLGGSAQGAVAMHRVSTTCAKQGYDGRYYTKQVDPIKSFGAPVSAHNHNAYGNINFSSTFSASTIQTISRQKPGGLTDPGYGPFTSNCPFYPDWPLYWFPSAKLNSVETTPGFLTSTLQSPAGTRVITPPFGAAFLSGSATATNPQPNVRFTCGGNTDGLGGGLDGPGDSKPKDCTNVPGGVVTGEITFPNCWDGQGVTTAPDGVFIFDQPYGIGTNHFTYAVNGVCPAGSIPCVPGQLMAQLVTQQTWMDNRATIAGVANPDFNKPLRNPLNPDGSVALSFSSGDYLTYHGDYIQTWNMSYFTGLVNQCLNYDGAGGGPCPFGTRVGLHNLE
jgi:hypothetical protein